MMKIEKIISGGQTGAERAALDVALEMRIPHGGWIPKGRKTEDGRLSDKYRLRETNAIDYGQRIELNIIDSEATLYFTHGEFTDESLLTKNLAKKHNRPCLHIDLDALSDYKAVEVIKTWIEAREMKVLFVSGSRASKDPMIYEDVFNVLKSALYPPPQRITAGYPNTVQEAVDLIISVLTEKEKADIARLKENEVPRLYGSLGFHIRETFDSWFDNEKFVESCRSLSGEDSFSKEITSSVVVRAIWEELRRTHSLRVVK
jgi:hypothetical protein